jgi:hypothetical protein
MGRFFPACLIWRLAVSADTPTMVTNDGVVSRFPFKVQQKALMFVSAVQVLIKVN